MSTTPIVTIQELLDAGVHFGHKTSRWNPKMSPYIYGIRDNIHLINLTYTVELLKIACDKIYKTVKDNGKVLFVGTKLHASKIIAESVQNCGQYYVDYRWLGGMLTNWSTISKSIRRLEQLEQILEKEAKIESEGRNTRYTKKELLSIERKKNNIERSLGGIRKMGDKPDLLVIIDTNKEHLAIKEAKKLGIPIVAVADTNSNPDPIDYLVPGNDDAIKSIKLYCRLFSEAVLRGIEHSLAASGVDLGAIVEDAASYGKFEAAKKIVKMKSNNKKFSKLATNQQNKKNIGQDGKEFADAINKTDE